MSTPDAPSSFEEFVESLITTVPPLPKGVTTIIPPHDLGGTVGMLHGMVDGIQPPFVPADKSIHKEPHEYSNKSLVELHQQCAARLAMYDNEAMFNWVMELRVELVRRLELRSPDLRDESVKVATMHVSEWHMENLGEVEFRYVDPLVKNLTPGSYPIYIGRAAYPKEASFEIQRLRQLILKGHPHVKNTRCRAHEPRADSGQPGPHNPPYYCRLEQGHEGPHRSQHGGILRQPVQFIAGLPGHCGKCRAPWPCSAVRDAGIIDLDHPIST